MSENHLKKILLSLLKKSKTSAPMKQYAQVKYLDGFEQCFLLGKTDLMTSFICKVKMDGGIWSTPKYGIGLTWIPYHCVKEICLIEVSENATQLPVLWRVKPV